MTGMCVYCGDRRAVNRDHVVPKSLQKKYPKRGRGLMKDDLLSTVPACFECNIRKGARRLVPPSWAERVPLLNELFPGTPWRVWQGSTSEPAYRDTWTPEVVR